MSHYLVIDVETSGADLVKNFLLATGACVVDSKTGCIDKSDEFLVYYQKPLETDFEQRCRVEFWDKKNEFSEYTNMKLLEIQQQKFGIVDPTEGTEKFQDYLEEMAKKYVNDLVIITDTAGFDVAWINYYLGKFSSSKRILSLNYVTGKYQPTRDVTSFYMGIGCHLPEDGLWGSKEVALSILNGKFPDFKVEHDHNPLNDAKTIAMQATYIAKLIRERYSTSKLQKK